MLARPFRDEKENPPSPQKGKIPILVKRIHEKRIRFPLRVKALPAAGEAGPRAAKTTNQKMRNCKSFLAVPSGDGPARRARVTSVAVRSATAKSAGRTAERNAAPKGVR